MELILVGALIFCNLADFVFVYFFFFAFSTIMSSINSDNHLDNLHVFYFTV